MSTPATASVHQLAKQPASSEGPRDRVDLRIDPKVRERLERQCERFGMDLSPYIRQAIIEKLERDEATDPERDE